METTDSSEWVIPQHKIMKKLDLMEIRIMKLTAEMNIYKEIIEKQNILMEAMHNNVKSLIKKVEKQEENKDEDLKAMVKEIKSSHDKLEENLSSIYFKQRRDNIFWRSYNNKFSNNCNNLMGFKDMLFKHQEKTKNKNKIVSSPKSSSSTPIILKMKKKSNPNTPINVSLIE